MGHTESRSLDCPWLTSPLAPWKGLRLMRGYEEHRFTSGASTCRCKHGPGRIPASQPFGGASMGGLDEPEAAVMEWHRTNSLYPGEGGYLTFHMPTARRLGGHSGEPNHGLELLLRRRWPPLASRQLLRQHQQLFFAKAPRRRAGRRSTGRLRDFGSAPDQLGVIFLVP